MILRLSVTVSALALLSAPAMAQAGPGGLFDRFDSDGDGAITMEEVRSWRTNFFEAADTDADGFITSTEIEAVQDRAAEQAQAREGGRRGRGPRGQRDPIANLDADGDRQLSRAEFVDAPFRALDRFDANGDGQLTRDELPSRRRGG